MDGIPDSTNGWMWWFFSVVFISFVINMVSSYAKPIFDNIGMKYSENRRKKIGEAKEKFDKLIDSFNTTEGISYLKIDLLSIYIQMSLVLLLTIIISGVLYNLVDLSMKFGGIYFYSGGEIFLYIRETIVPIIYIVGLIVWLFLLNKAKLLNSVLKKLYSMNTKLNELENISS